MLRFFDMTAAEDPCNRGDTIIGGGRVTNSGERACRISVSVSALGGVVNIKLGFDIPSALKASISRENDSIIVDFFASDSANVAEFWIDNTDLNRDWGGKIRSVIYGPSKTIVDTENGCLRYSY
jgi:hypothetical protein